MFSPEEWTVIRTGLDIVTVQGKDAKSLSMLQSKVEKEIQKSINKKNRELQKAKKQYSFYIYNKIIGPQGKWAHFE